MDVWFTPTQKSIIKLINFTILQWESFLFYLVMPAVSTNDFMPINIQSIRWQNSIFYERIINLDNLKF